MVPLFLICINNRALEKPTVFVVLIGKPAAHLKAAFQLSSGSGHSRLKALLYNWKAKSMYECFFLIIIIKKFLIIPSFQKLRL